ncbi:MAG: twin-arginine translocase TatA/TatE family subunit [Firmicutes bacterium]|jgi:sec-independent protein translocase protein TatA|nr:twin-arginine translocase TatA/TatE family subunit [Dethiobacter sp.]MBS3899851.1 twin-arginine translocase TatA/TatE family subunit [Dethiobacter sp.]MCL4463693.1 twin-arginine translocase TatA/TatE family subunit [Bacillota bacterium]MCL5994088.1 twin-arginine translocase TatA/TatE family subunit [Bacillota bacterium]
MFGRIGPQELLLILALVLIIFGPRKLPEIGRSLGRGLKEFKQAALELRESVDIEEVKEQAPKENNPVN